VFYPSVGTYTVYLEYEGRGLGMKPTDAEIIAAMMEWDNGFRSVTYVIRNRIGRTRCTSRWILAQLKRLEKYGKVRRSLVQDRADMIQWDVVK
jgi:hypothetical protein